MDAFKGCLSSLDAGHAVALGLRRVFMDADIVVSPIADGGEGTLEALATIERARRVQCCTENPLGEPIQAEYLILPGHLAVIEIAQAAGLNLTQRRDPLHASTYGVGLLIRDAIDKGCRQFFIGLGGSATNDGGAGMLQALGFQFTDLHGNPIPRGAIGLKELAGLDESHVLPAFHECSFDVACDVTAPLCGPSGASMVFAPQKGATLQNIQDMEHWLAHYSGIVQKYRSGADPNAQGAGAAGGLGFALKTFCHAELQSGLPLIAKHLKLDEKIRNADYIFTGEGKIDAQTAMGKVPAGIASIARPYRKPVIALTGSIDGSLESIDSLGLSAVFAIQKRPCSLSESMCSQTAQTNLSDTAEQIARLIQLSRHS